MLAVPPLRIQAGYGPLLSADCQFLLYRLAHWHMLQLLHISKMFEPFVSYLFALFCKKTCIAGNLLWDAFSLGFSLSDGSLYLQLPSKKGMLIVFTSLMLERSRRRSSQSREMASKLKIQKIFMILGKKLEGMNTACVYSKFFKFEFNQTMSGQGCSGTLAFFVMWECF